MSEHGCNHTNLKMVGCCFAYVPVSDFARKLQVALEGIGASIAFLYKVPISSHLGRHAIARMGKLKVYYMLGVSAVITINPAPPLSSTSCSYSRAHLVQARSNHQG
jgi:hypothetical protein